MLKSRAASRLLVVLTGLALLSVGCVKKFSPTPENTNFNNSEASQPGPSAQSLISHYEFYADGGFHADGSIYNRLGSSLIDPTTNERSTLTAPTEEYSYKGNAKSISILPNQDRFILLTSGNGEGSVYIQDFNIDKGVLVGPPRGISFPLEPTSIAITPDGRIAFISTANQMLFTLIIGTDGTIRLGPTPPTSLRFAAESMATLDLADQHLVVIKGACSSELQDITGQVTSPIATYRADPESGKLSPLLSNKTLSYSSNQLYAFNGDDTDYYPPAYNDPGASKCVNKGQPLQAIPNSNRLTFASFSEPQFDEIQISPDTGEVLKNISKPNHVGVDPTPAGRFPALVTFLPPPNTGASMALMQVDNKDSTSVWGTAPFSITATPAGTPYASIDGSQLYIPYVFGTGTSVAIPSISVLTYQIDPLNHKLTPRSTHLIGGSASSVAFLEVLKQPSASSLSTTAISPARRLSSTTEANRPINKKIEAAKIQSQSNPVGVLSDYQMARQMACALAEGKLLCRSTRINLGPIVIGNGSPQIYKKLTPVGFLDENVLSFSLSDTHFCALVGEDGGKEKPTIWCQGQNTSGNLGISNNFRNTIPVTWFPIEASGLEGALNIESSFSSLDPPKVDIPRAALTSDSILKTSSYQTCVTSSKGIVCTGDSMGGFSYARVRQPIQAKDIAFGTDYHEVGTTNTMCALDKESKVYCWPNSLSSSESPNQVTKILENADQIVGETSFCARVGREVQCWTDYTGKNLQKISLPEDAVRIEVSGGRTMAILTSGNVASWHIVGNDHTQFTKPIIYPELKGLDHLGVDAGIEVCGLSKGKEICIETPEGYWK